MLKISYEQLEQDSFLLAKKIRSNLDTTRIDLVSISRGGLFVGGLLSYLLDLKRNRVICLESYQSNSAGANPFMNEIIDLEKDLDPSRIYLFVDDVNDTGQTCSFIKQKMKQRNLEHYFATIYNKDHTKTNPDFFGRELPGDMWIEFPWDKAVDSFKTFMTISNSSSLDLLEIGLEQILDSDNYNNTVTKK